MQLEERVTFLEAEVRTHSEAQARRESEQAAAAAAGREEGDAGVALVQQLLGEKGALTTRVAEVCLWNETDFLELLSCLTLTPPHLLRLPRQLEGLQATTAARHEAQLQSLQDSLDAARQRLVEADSAHRKATVCACKSACACVCVCVCAG